MKERNGPGAEGPFFWTFTQLPGKSFLFLFCDDFFSSAGIKGKISALRPRTCFESYRALRSSFPSETPFFRASGPCRSAIRRGPRVDDPRPSKRFIFPLQQVGASYRGSPRVLTSRSSGVTFVDHHPPGRFQPQPPQPPPQPPPTLKRGRFQPQPPQPGAPTVTPQPGAAL